MAVGVPGISRTFAVRAAEHGLKVRCVEDKTYSGGDRFVRCAVAGLRNIDITLDYGRNFPPVVTLFDGGDEVERWGWDRPDGFDQALKRAALMHEAAARHG